MAKGQSVGKTDILIVDDQKVNLLLLEEILKGPDVNIVMAMSGPEALDLMEQYDFALVLLDVMMPGMDGFTLAEKMRGEESTKYIPIIFITAVSTDQRSVFKGYDTGAVDYLIKPLDSDVLKRKVAVFIDIHRQRQILEKTTRKLERTVKSYKKTQQALIQSEERYRIISDYGQHWESWIGPDNQMLYVSLSCERITGYPAEKFMEDSAFIEQLIHRDDYAQWKQYMEDLDHIEDGPVDYRFFREDGRMIWISQVSRVVSGKDGQHLGIRCSMSDITDRKHLEMQLRHQALHDPLTGLANRTLCLERIRQAIERSRRRDNYHYAVIFLDLDRFKIVNDSFGHSFGDKILMEVSKRLLNCVRSLDTVSRFGGDEYVILLEELSSPREAIRCVKRTTASLEHPYTVDGHEVQLSACFGMVLNQGEYSNPAELLQHADIAMHKAKKLGMGRMKVFNKRLHEQAVRLMTLENDIRRGVANNEFFLEYQPIYNLDNKRLYGFEALVRWLHPDKGLIGPNQFIPVAEESGLIMEIGMKVLSEACATMATWGDRFPEVQDLMMAVNISGKQFSQADLYEKVRRLLQDTGMNPQQLKLEITETTIMENAERAVDKLNRLKGLGIVLSIDDFGTGYSSMSYLQRFPLDNLKIDLSFVKMMHVSQEHVEIVKTIINLAHTLNLSVVAEGIELPEHERMLREMKCEYGQGYLYSRPVPIQEAEKIIQNR